jgi:hypothetical protein
MKIKLPSHVEILNFENSIISRHNTFQFNASLGDLIMPKSHLITCHNYKVENKYYPFARA